MGAVVIYATILIGGIVEVIQYKAEIFKTNEECVSYLQTYNTHVNKTLQAVQRKVNLLQKEI
jgi:hypothetical protein